MLRMVLPGLLLLVCGCTTTEMWKDTNLKTGATESSLRLYESPRHQDILVVYNEVSERDGKTRRRAYYLNAFEQSKRTHPEFVSPGRAARLVPVPILDTNSVLTSTNSGLAVAINPNGVEFALWSNGRELAVYRLPEYTDATDQTRKVFLTPFTLVVDIVLVAVAAGAIAGIAYLCAQ